MQLTVEQQNFIDSALTGNNVLVDACVGSGKTTAIQQLCMAFPRNKRILYLTYNKLLKIDAKEKIKGKNITVTNYHGFAYLCLIRTGIKAGISDLIQVFLNKKPSVGAYDLLVLDEYQDIDQEISDMLTYIKECNPDMQIVAVGDMKQKIYDKTALDVQQFIDGFVGKREDLEFTQCFRLSRDIAEMLGRVWEKKIIGVNQECKISYLSEKKVVKFLSEQQPEDILCLGARNGLMSRTLNTLEDKYSPKYNKKTVYASISDSDRSGSTEPSKETAIFTTYDSSKGLERKICVVFDFTESYWAVRRDMPEQKYEILRNIFCVAASRGKEQIIFVEHDEAMLSEQSLSTPNKTNHKFKNMQISEMFDFKYKEDVEECFGLLDIKKIDREDTTVIKIENHEDLIDQAPCIGIYQEASFFEKYDIDKDIELYKLLNKDKKVDATKYKTLDKKILYLISLETSQNRYIRQVNRKIVEDEQRVELENRLLEIFTKQDDSQEICEIQFAKKKGGIFEFSAVGYADVIKNKVVYELKFVSELTHEHFLQCACYVVAKRLKKGVLWNTRTNDMYEISIPDKDKFLDCVAKTITKHQLAKYYKPKGGTAWLKDLQL